MRKLQPLTAPLHIRMKPETLEALQAAANHEQRTLSDYVRVELERIAMKYAPTSTPRP